MAVLYTWYLFCRQERCDIEDIKGPCVMVPESYWQAMYDKVGAPARRLMHTARKRKAKMQWGSQGTGDASTISLWVS